MAAAGTMTVGDLLGRKVSAEDGRLLGEIVDVMATGANDVWVIRGAEGELLFPALKSLVADLPLPGNTATVRLLPGLLDACLRRGA